MSNTAKFLDDFKEQFVIKEEGDSVQTDESPEKPSETTENIEVGNENDSEQGQERPSSENSETNRDGRQEGLLKPSEEDGADSDSVSYVPSFVLKAEKDRRRELEKKLEELQSAANASQSQPEQVRQPAPEAEPEIDYYADPDAWYKKEIETQKSQLNEFIQEQRAQTQIRELNTVINESINKEMAVIPDLGEALDYLFKAQYKSRVLLYGDTEEAARKNIQLNVMQLSAMALQKGKSPAKMLYEAAQALNYMPTNKAKSSPSSTTERRKVTTEQLAENIRKNSGVSGSSGASSVDDGDVQPIMNRLGAVLKDKREYQKAKDIIRKARA